MIGMLLAGAALGGVLFVLIGQLAPRRTAPVIELGQLYAHYRAGTAPGPASPAVADGWRARLGAWVSAELSKRGVHYAALRQDLVLTGHSYEALMGRKVVWATIGFLVGLLPLSAIAASASRTLPSGAPLVVGLIFAAAPSIAIDIDARKEAKKRRREFTEQLSIFLDLVSLKMAGQAAAATALPDAAQRGGTWPMMLIRDTLYRAKLSGQDQWEALSQLGERIAVPDLRELGALVKLVASDGAQVRATLSARAASMRRARLADEQAIAEERTQSMRLAQILIALGFALFIGYAGFVSVTF